MNKFFQLTATITLGLMICACSNNPLQTSSDNEDIDTIDRSASSADEKYNFRNTTWGMSKEEVMQSEDTNPVFESEYKIDYEIQMLGYDSKIGYTFNNDELIRASFLLLGKPKSNSEFIEIYENIQKQLKKKYGKTVIDTIQHKDPSKNIQPDDFADAVCRGDLLYATQWDTKSSDIQLLLRGENSECFLTLMYISEEGFRQMIKDSKNKQ